MISTLVEFLYNQKFANHLYLSKFKLLCFLIILSIAAVLIYYVSSIHVTLWTIHDLKPDIPLDPCDPRLMPNSVWIFETKLNWTTPRSLCAVESLTIQNPKRCIRFLVLDFHDSDPRHILAKKILKERQNVRITALYPDEILSETPFKHCYGAQARASPHFAPNLADCLRVAVLYKYGGTHVDFDVIAVKPLPSLPFFLSRVVTGGAISSALMRASEPRRELLWLAMENGQKRFQPLRYATMMISFHYTVETYCKGRGFNVSQVDEKTIVGTCDEWKILGADAGAFCRPYEWSANDSSQHQMMQMLAENCTLWHWSYSYDHFFKKFNHRPINLKTEPYLFIAQLAQKFCPTVATSVTIF